MLSFPRPYPLPQPRARLDRDVAREAVLGTAALLFVVVVAASAIAISGWLPG